MESTLAFGVIFSILIGGVGLPLGVPPQQEDPVLARLAPADCIFYTAWAGMAAPQGDSQNATERLLADPEIRQAVASLEKLVAQQIERGADEGDADEAALLRQASHWTKFALSHAGAAYLESIAPGPEGPNPRGAIVLQVGMEGVPLLAFLKQLHQLNSRLEVTEITVGASKFYRYEQVDGPPVLYGLVKDYFVIAVGEGTVERLLERMRGTPPIWHTAIGQKLPIARRATLTYLNVTRIRELVGGAGGLQGQRVLSGLGLDNVTELVSATGLDETGFVSRTLVGMKGRPLGLLGLADGKPLAASDLAVIPADATVALVVRRDAADALERIQAILAAIDPRAATELEQGLTESEGELGLAWRQEILGTLGDVWRIYSSPADGGLILPGLSLVVDVKDAPRLRAAVAQFVRMVEERADEPMVSVTKFAGQEIVTLTPPGEDFLASPSLCITGDKLIVAAFPQPIKAFLSRDAEFRGLDTVPEAAAALANSRPTALAYQDTRELVRLLYPSLPILMAALRAERSELVLDPAMLPSCPALTRHLRPSVAALSVRTEGLEFTSRQTIPGGSIGASGPLLAGLLLPAVQSWRGSAERVSGMNNLRQIGIAMHNYHDTRGGFPPAILSKDGKPLLSWRVAILPFIEEQNLYQQFRLDEPWDSEHNKKLIPQMPRVYLAPGSRNGPNAGKTNYLTIRSPASIFPGDKGRRISEVRDGTSNTVMAVEASDAAAVIWTKPDDYVPDEQNPLKDLAGLRRNGFSVVMADGAVRFISVSIDPKVWKLLVECNDGQPIDQRQLEPPPARPFSDGPAKKAPHPFPGGEEKKGAAVPPPEVQPAAPGPQADRAANGPPGPAPLATFAQRTQGSNHLKMLALAALNYESARKTFPPAYVASPEGKPLLSWRVLVLPYLEQNQLYQQFRLDEPWDSEHNRKLIPLMPLVFRAPASRLRASDGKTNYLAIRAPQSVIAGPTGVDVRSVTDGLSNTILFVETSDEAAVPWTSPDDFVPTDSEPLRGLAGFHRQGFLAAFADGSVRMIRRDVAADAWKRLYERSDGQPIGASEFEVPPPKPLFPSFDFGFGGAPPATKKAPAPPAVLPPPEARKAERPDGAQMPVPVRGTLTLDGQPVAGATVQFLPQQGLGVATGVTDARGQFQLSTPARQDGVLPGSYRVVIRSAPAKGEAPRESIPARYADPATTNLQVQVAPQAGRQEVHLALDSAP